jgi:hypothetical protein
MTADSVFDVSGSWFAERDGEASSPTGATRLHERLGFVLESSKEVWAWTP